MDPITFLRSYPACPLAGSLKQLNRRGITTAEGGKWHAAQVILVRERLRCGAQWAAAKTRQSSHADRTLQEAKRASPVTKKKRKTQLTTMPIGLLDIL